MKTRLLSGVHVFCGETIVPEGLTGLQLSFNFTVRETIIGGIFMPRSYRHVKEYEKEILAFREKGFSRKEIADKLGMNMIQIKNFINRYNRQLKRLNTGISLNRKGRPPKNYTISEQDKVSELKYILARKEAKIKSLEMENELMRDFLSRTERK